MVYPGQADREAAQERAELRYLRAQVKELQASAVKPAAPTPPPAQGRTVGQIFRDAPWAPEMVVLPSGRFLMGSPEREPGRLGNEGPQHEVTIAYRLAMGKYPVTFEEWDACVADGGTTHTPSDEGWGRGKRPVINVSWDDAQRYVAWLNQKLGMLYDPTRYRLPSEAEWEYACRAGTTTAYWWGNDFDAERCTGKFGVRGAIKRVFFDSSGTQPVDALGAASVNPWGLSGTHGNVWEWVQDCWNSFYIDWFDGGAPSDGRAWTIGDGRVLRGGSWNIVPRDLRAAYRKRGKPGSRDDGVGFRIARTVS